MDISVSEDQRKIKRLKKELEGLRGRSEISTLQAEVDGLKKQDVNSQVSDQQSMTNLKGYDEEFERLKEDTVKQQKNYKMTRIKTSIGSMFSIPIAGAVVYALIKFTGVISFLELDPDSVTIVYWVILAVFTMIEINAVFTLIKAIFIDPKVIPDQTLSYLSLTAKEHILDPKGSIIREKYGTAKWTAVTQT